MPKTGHLCESRKGADGCRARVEGIGPGFQTRCLLTLNRDTTPSPQGRKTHSVIGTSKSPDPATHRPCGYPLAGQLWTVILTCELNALPTELKASDNKA